MTSEGEPTYPLKNLQAHEERQRHRARQIIDEIGETGDSKEFGELFREYGVLSTKRQTDGAFTKEAQSRFDALALNMRVSFGYGSPGFLDVYSAWRQAEDVRNARASQLGPELPQ